VPLKEPSWWYGSAGDAGGIGGGQGEQGVPLAARLLTPLAFLYGWVAVSRFRRAKPYSSTLPVICVGNFTAGGTGKTPTALALCAMLEQMGEHPAFLTRGYGGSRKGPHWVNSSSDRAQDVGDEPLLLARRAPTMIARDRRSGARAIERGPPGEARRPTVIIMDDGLQNPSLVKDLTIGLVSAARGIGNGRVIPAGPLRMPMPLQLGLVDVVVSTGVEEDDANALQILRERTLAGFGGPLLRAWPQATGNLDWLGGVRVLAFAGIAAPQRFYNLLERLGADIVERRSFKDHHPLSNTDALELTAQAARLNAQIVTTDKDFVRLGHSSALSQLREQACAVSVNMTFDVEDKQILAKLLRQLLQKRTNRSS